ncbi:MAG: host attachment protein [Steroidobacteraceae bacterium]
MPGYRVIVADTAQAVMYELEAPGAPLRETGRLDNPAGHQHERDLGSGKPGRVMNRLGTRHSLQGRRTHKQHETEHFARLVAKSAATDARSAGCDGLVLVAAPRFLAEVKAVMPQAALKRVRAEIRRNLVETPKLELRKKVQAAFLRT